MLLVAVALTASAAGRTLDQVEVRNPGGKCTLRPQEVLDRVELAAIMECTTLNRIPYAMRRDDERTVWFVTIRPDDTADPREENGWVVLDDVTGREIARGTYPDHSPEEVVPPPSYQPAPPDTVVPPSGVAPKPQPDPPVPPNP